jgi:hypothetical protein
LPDAREADPSGVRRRAVRLPTPGRSGLDPTWVRSYRMHQL